ncbi:hypothetical protein QTP86_029531, partial [Hemibagrus guttatus]
MPLEPLPGVVFRACPTGMRPRGRPRTRWRDYVSWLTLESLGIPPEELEEVSKEREVWASLLRLLPPFHDLFKAKLGLLGDDEGDVYLISFLLKLMYDTFTMTFRQLSESAPAPEELHHSSVNPRYVLRNWMAESAIRKAENNGFSE